MAGTEAAPAAEAAGNSLTVHRLADLFPMLPADELRALADDIKANGLRHPIRVDQQNRIIDGRNREKACQLAAVAPTYEPFVGTEKQIAAFIASANLRRRHLTPSQCASIAAGMANMSRGGDRRSDQTATLQNGEPAISQSDAAEIMGVSERSVAKAAKVRKKGTKQLQQAVTDGEISVNRAAEIVDLPRPEQNAAIAKPKPKVFDDGQWNKLIGPVVRFVMARAEHLGGKSQRYNKISALLRQLCEEFEAWQAEAVICGSIRQPVRLADPVCR